MNIEKKFYESGFEYFEKESSSGGAYYLFQIFINVQLFL